MNYKQMVEEYGTGGLYLYLGIKYGVKNIEKKAGRLFDSKVFNRLKRSGYLKGNKICLDNHESGSLKYDGLVFALAGAVGEGYLKRR